MGLSFFKNTVFILFVGLYSCGNITADSTTVKANAAKLQKSESQIQKPTLPNNTEIITGANQWSRYLPLLQGKKIGVVANQTSVINDTIVKKGITTVVQTHLIDFMYNKQQQLQVVFAPEHGFRGTADAGELVKDGVDVRTGIPIVSLYGKNKKPTNEQLKGIDLVVFDIQDVGARFYTYISSLHYVMEACAENNIPLLILDRPNPNGHYIDGPLLEKEHTSFVGMHPIPVVHGMTIGEYAQMINGEKWLKNGVQCELKVIEMKNYTHNTPYSLPVKPSPNLPNDVAINLYPSICFFEGTFISEGRGTDKQFQIFGAPSLPSALYPYQFTPQANEGAKHPKFKGQLCNGLDLSNTNKLDQLQLKWLIEAYSNSENKETFFTDFFTTLAGTKKLRQQIEQGLSYNEIRASWSTGLTAYNKMRQPYLLYK